MVILRRVEKHDVYVVWVLLFLGTHYAHPVNSMGYHNV